MDQVIKPFQDFVEYVKTERLANLAFEDIKSVLLPFLLFFLIVPLIFGAGLVARFIEGLLPKKKCKICGREASDVLSDSSSHELGVFCRNHLIQEYSKHFLNSSFNKVIVEFQPRASGDLGTVYGYYPISEIEQFGWEKKSRQVVENLLLTINGKKCRECDEPATSLFVSKEAAPWSKYGPEPSLDYAKIGEYLCNEHTLDRIKPSIQTNPKRFNDGGGLWLPYKEGGFQVGTEL